MALSLLDGPAGCDPAFCVVWFRFRLLRRYLALWPEDVGGVYRLLWSVRAALGMVLSTFSLLVLLRLGFGEGTVGMGWIRPGLPLLGNWLVLFSISRLLVLTPVASDLCGREDFRGGPLLDVRGSLQFLHSSHVREREKALLRSVMVGGGRVRGQPVPCRFCGAPDDDGRLFWECTCPPLVEIRENPEFHDLMRMDKAQWPRCLLWHGWLPMVSGASPWAADASESAGYLVEAALGHCSSGLFAEWSPPEGFDGARAASFLPEHSNVWTDGSLVLDLITGVSSSGAGFFAHESEGFLERL